MKRTLQVLMAVFVAAAVPVLAQAPKLEEGRGQVTLSWNEFVKITGYDPAKKGAQVLTIPWKDVEDMLGVKVEQVGQKGMVDLPWKDFKALLEWSIKRKEAKEEAPPPTDYIVTSSRYVGKLTADRADFELTAKLNVLRKKGWKRIPVLPLTVALTKTTLEAGVFINSAGGAYELLTEKSGPIDVTVSFSVAVQKSAGINQVSFPRVLPGSSLVELTIAGKQVDVKVTGSQSLVSKTVGDTAVGISWERALPKVAAAPTKLYAETRTLVAVAEGLLLCQEVINYNILHTAVRELSLQVPTGASVLTVSGSNVQDWRVDADGKLQVVLRGEVIGSYVLRLTYEQAPKATAAAPVIHPAGIERERGYVGVVALTNVEIAPGKVVGATGIDVRQLPADIVAMTNQPILLAFRYLGSEFSIPLTIKKHAEVGVLVTIG